jgi:hypothetical protein
VGKPWEVKVSSQVNGSRGVPRSRTRQHVEILCRSESCVQLQALSADNCTQTESRELEGEDDSADPFLLWFHVILMMRFLLRVLCFLVPPPFSVPLFALTLPHRLEAMADAVLGMFNIDLLLLLLQVRVMQTRNWDIVN